MAFKECYGIAILGEKVYFTDAGSGSLKMFPFKIIREAISAAPLKKEKDPPLMQVQQIASFQGQKSQDITKCWEIVLMKLKRPYGLTVIGESLVFSLEEGN
jgi:hypothetical protein